MAKTRPFYETKTLKQMTNQEWESLCDGCGKCCVVLLQDDEDGAVYRTSLGCQLLDLKTIKCCDYQNRHSKIPDCVKLDGDNINQLSWMPQTCAYRLIHEGKPLFDWHPLKSGQADSVHKAGISVMGQLTHETHVDEDDYQDYIIED